MAAIIPVSFVGSDEGTYRVLRMETVMGAPLTPVAALTSYAKHLPPARPVRPFWRAILRLADRAVTLAREVKRRVR